MTLYLGSFNTKRKILYRINKELIFFDNST